MPKALAKKPANKSSALTAKQKAKYDLFIEHYMANGRNGTLAAIAAGYSKKSAGTMAGELLKIPYVSENLKKNMESTLRRLGVTREEVIARLTAIARADPRTVQKWGFKPLTMIEDGVEVPVMGPNGKPAFYFDLEPIDSDKLSHEAAISIESIKFKQGKFGPEIKITQRDSIAALKILAEHFGITNVKGDDEDDEDSLPVGRITRIEPQRVDARKPKP